MGRPFVGPPGIPADRAEGLRKAYASFLKGERQTHREEQQA